MFKNRNLTRIAVISTVLIALTAVTATAAIGIPGFSIFDTITTFFGGAPATTPNSAQPEPTPPAEKVRHLRGEGEPVDTPSDDVTAIEATKVNVDGSSADLVTVATYPFASTTGVSLEDMSGSATLVAASNDDTASSVTSIGFDFWLDGVRYTQFSANANGLMKLGSVVVDSSTNGRTNDFATANDLPKIAAYWDDLCTDATGKVHSKIIGTAPNRKLVVEFNNMRTYNAGCTGGTLLGNYQIWLYESAHPTLSGRIQYVYGSIPVNPNANSGYSIGFGSSSTSFVSVTSTGPTAVYGTSTNSQVGAIASGTSYTFTPTILTAPGAVSFTSINQTGMTVNWTDTNSSPNEVGYAVYQSNDGGTTYNFVAQTAANATSQAITGLVPSTTYFFRVYAISEGALSGVSSGSQATTAAGNISSTGTGGNWSSTGTWVGGVVPTAVDNVTIVDGATVTIDTTTATCLNLTVGGGTSGILQYITTPASTLTVNGDVTVAAGGTFSAGSGALTTHNLNIGGTSNTVANAGNLTVNGTFDMNIGTAGVTTNFFGSANGTVSGSGATADFFAIVVNKGTTTASILDVTRVITTSSPTTSGTRMAITNGTLKMSSASTLTPYFGSQTIAASTGRLWINNASASIQCVGTGTSATGSGSATIDGTLQVDAGTFGYGQGNNTVTVNGSLVMGGASAVVNVFGRFVTGTAPNITISAGNLNIDPQNVTSAAASDVCTFTTGSIVNFTGGTLTIVDPNVNNSTAGNTEFEVAGTTGTKNFAGSTIRFGDGTSTSSGNATNLGFQISAPSSVVLGNVVVNNPSGTNRNVRISATISTTLNVTGLAVTAGTFTLNSNALLTTGNIVNSGVIDGSAASSTLYFFGTSTPTSYSGAGTMTTPMTTLSIDNPAGVTLNAASPGFTALRVNLFTGTLTNSNKVTLGNGAATSAITQVGATGLLTPGGSYDVAPTFNPGTGGNVIIYAQESVARTTGVEIPATRSVANMTINNTNGVTLSGGNLSLSGTLTLTAGKLTTSSTNLPTITNTATGGISGGSTTSYVNGPLVRTLPASLAATTYTWPIGKSGYNLFELVNATTSGAGTMTVQAEAFDASSGGTAGTGITTLNTNRYWSAATGGAGALTAATVRVNESPLTGNRIGQSTTVNGTYNSIGSTVSGTTIAGTASPLTLGFFNLGSVTLGGNVSICNGGTYPTLKSFFDAVNTSTLTSDINVTIAGDCAEGANTATLNQWTESGVGGYKITLTPSGNRTITGNPTGGSPLIDLNGADRVKIDGLNDGTNSLTISNTTASATVNTSTIRFINDASGNTVTNSTISGSFNGGTGVVGGTILFSTTTGTTGNDTNTISNNNVGPAGSNLATTGIYFGGSSNTDPGTGNSGNTVSGNNIFDYFGAAVASAGINVLSGTPSGTFSNNKLYQTATRTQTTSSQHAGIIINNSSGNGYQVTGNTIGFSSSGGTGTYTLNGVSNTFKGIHLLVGSTSASNIQNNTISNFSQTTAASGTTTSAPIILIYPQSGLITTTGNIVGSLTGTGSIAFSSSSSSTSDVIGIFNFSSQNSLVNNNNVGSINVANSSTGAIVFQGIRTDLISSVTATISGNTIGGTTANSINNTATATGSRILGIVNATDIAAITGNTIRNLTMLAGNTGVGSSTSAIGINQTSTAAGQTVSQNTIHTLTNNHATSAVGLTGIFYTGTTTGTNTVSRNSIYGLTAVSSASEARGIEVTAGTTTFSNNMIALGAGNTTSTWFNGLYDNGGTNNWYNNSVYISGTNNAANGNPTAAAYVNTSNTKVFRNNILFNARSNSVATTVKHYAISIPNVTGFTSNNNLLYVTGTGGFVGINNPTDFLTLANWRTGTAQDANSISADPVYVDQAGAIPNLHIQYSSPAKNSGATIAAVTNDIDNDNRPLELIYEIGADEYTDANNPDTSIDTGAPGTPTNPTTSTSATFTFSGTDSIANPDAPQAVASYECALDTTTFTACTSPQSYGPGLSIGSHNFKVRTVDAAGNRDASPAEVAWSIVAPAPTITSLNPASGWTDTTVIIVGTNFTGATAVSFGGTPATFFTVPNDGFISATAPAHAAGVVDVTVTGPGGTSANTSADDFTYITPDAAPEVNFTNPANGATGVSITQPVGVGFSENVSLAANAITLECPSGNMILQYPPSPMASVAGVTFYPTMPSTTTCTVTVDASKVNDVDANDPPDFMAANYAFSFTTATPPTVTALNPPSGSTVGGNIVTIDGTNFTGVTDVTFDGVTAAFTFVSATKMSATAPAHAAGAVDVRVTTPGGTSATNANAVYTYVAPGDHFRSRVSGDWGTPGTWESSPDGNDPWTTATSSPDSSSLSISIQSGHTVTVTAAANGDQMTCAGTLIVNDGVTFTLNNDIGTDFGLTGTLNAIGTGVISGAGQFVMSSGSSLGIGSPAGITAAGATGSIQTAGRTFDSGANYSYIGSVAQVTGSGLPGANSLTINNSSGVTLSGPTGVSTLALTNGKVTTTAGNILSVGNPAVGAISGGSSTSYVNGPLLRVIPSNLGAGSVYVFPVGKGGYNPLEMVDTITGLSDVFVIVEEFDATANPIAGLGLSTVNTDRYWKTELLFGSQNFTSTKIRLTNSSPLTVDSRVAKGSAPSTVFNSVGGTFAGSTVLSDPVTSTGYFAIGTATPTVTTTGSLTGFGPVTVGNTSPAQSYSVSGFFLTGNLTVTAPTGFEVSQSQFSGFTNTFDLVPASGVVNSTTVWVRFAPASAITYSDNVTNASTGATTQNVAVTGTGVAPTTVLSLTRAHPNPTNLNDVMWTIEFAAPVSGVATGNFALVNGGLTTPSITSVNPQGTAPKTKWNISVNTGSGSGTLGLNFVNATGLTPGVSTTLPVTGDEYIIDKSAPETTIESGPPLTTTSTDATFVFGANDNMLAEAQLAILHSFVCELDGVVIDLGCTSAKSYTGLSIGSHTFKVRATDRAGNTDPSDATYTWLIVPPPTLGNYDDKTVAFAGNTTVTPSAPPANATNLVVSASTGYAGAFAGGLTINQTTGVVTVTDAHPAGTYTVTVNAFGPGSVATDTFVLTVSPGATCGQSSFDPAVNYTAGTNPNKVVTNDVNLDGKPDMVVANGVSNNVSVRLGNGSGGFGAVANFAVGDHPNSIAVADLNLDGNPDIATANDLSTNLSILLGNGSGGFSAATSVSTGNNPFGVVTADFNFDGKPDLAAANSTDGNVSVFLGDGAGGFGAATNFGVGTNPIEVAVGDFNNDGKADLVTANNGSNNVSVLIGNGLGGFAAAANFSVGTLPQSLAVGDLNHDGKLDIVVTTTAALGASVLIGDGTGSFAAATSTDVGTNPTGVAISDVNLDGHPDLVVTNFAVPAPNVSVTLGDGTGVYATPAAFGAGGNTRSVAAGDFNLDGKPDLAVANSGSANVSVLLNVCVAPVVDLTILKSDGGATVAAGGTVAYTLNYANNGTTPATGVVLTETVPAHSSFNAGVSTAGWVCTPNGNAGNNCTLAVGSLAFGGSGSAVFAVDVETPILGGATQIDNTATIADDGTHGADVNLTNNSSSDSTPLNIPISFAINDVTANEGDAGSTLFTFTITKTGLNGQPTTITLQTCDVSATAPGDYTSLGSCIVAVRPSGAESTLVGGDTVTFAPTDTSKEVTVLVVGDTVVEPDETFTLKMVTSTNGTFTDDEGLGTIVNDDSVCAPPPPNMTAWYDGSGAAPTANDIGGSNNGTLQSGAVFAPGKVGQAFALNGGASVVDVPRSASLESGFVSVDAWVRPDSVGTTYNIVTKNNTSAIRPNYGLELRADGRFNFYASSANGNFRARQSNTLAVAGTWYHVAGTWDGTEARLYINGVDEAGPADAGGLTGPIDHTNGANLTIGAHGFGSPLPAIDGVVDEVEIFSRALDPGEIAAIATAGSAGKCHTSTVRFAQATDSITEDGAVTFTAIRDGANDSAVTVNYLFNNGGTDTATGGAACGGAVDYVNGNDQFSFGVGVSSIPFAVDTCPDAAIEGNETFTLTLANPSSGLSIVAPATETVTIVDDDFAPTQDTDVTLSGSALTIEDVNGANTNDDLRLSCNGANLRINDPTHLLYAGAGTQIDPNTVEVPLAGLTSILVNSLAGNDALTVDLSGCDIVPSSGITFNGGDPTSGTGDRLNIVGGNQGQVTYHYTNASDGNVQMQNFGTVNYTGLEPISNTGTASDVIFELPAGANAATLGDDGTGGNGMSRLSGATFEDTDFANPTSSVTIKRGDAADTLAVNALPDLNSSINIGTSVDTFSTIAFNGAVTLASGNSLAGFAAGTISFPNGTSDIATSGAGTIALTTATNVSMLSGSSLTTVDGALTINANQQVTPTAGNFNGINIDAATVQSTGSGVVTVNGKGGTVGGGQHGVLVISGGLIRGGNAAGITTNVNGTGGAATGVSNIGVIVIDGGASITSNGGNVSVIGTGGSGAGGDHHGVRVFNAVSAASISAGSSGTVTVSGTGGSAAAGGCFGVDVRTAGAAITSNGGAVTINGQGGACAQNVGVVVTGASIQSGTNGPVSVTGTGGTSAGTNNDGLNMNGGNISATGAGTVTIDSTATFGTSSEGIDLSGGSPSITTALNSAITMIGDSMNLGAGSINSGTGPVTIRQKTAIVAINLGTSGDPLGGPLNLLDAEIDRVTAGTLFVGNSNSGTITTSAAITHPNNLTLTTGRGITFTSPVTMAVDKTLTGNAEGTATGAISVNAALGSTGTGGVALTTARNIAITQGISTVNGPITLNANQTNTGTGAFFGVNIDGAAAIVQASGSGVVTINGRGGNSGNSIGIGMANSSVVKGGSTFGVTTTSLTGTGGSGNNTHGLQIGAGASISSFGGNISVIGTAGAGDSAGQNIGFILYPTGTISSTVNGSVTVAGTGGTGGNLNEGIRIDGSLSKISAAGSGNVTVTATAGANSSNGLDLSRSGSIGTASGTIQITGTHGSTGGTGIWLNPGSSGNPIISSTNATITLIADRMDFAAGSVSANAGIVNIRQKTNNQQINLGGADSAVQLGLIDVELDRVTAGTMNIGDAFTGAVSVSNAITQTKLTNIFSTSTTVLTGGDLGIFGTVNSTLAANSGGTIRPGASPGVINSGDLNLASGSTYAVEIGGTIPGNGVGRHDQLNVTGTVALGGNLTLAQSGGFNPANGNTFVIINNDLGDLVSGTFNGLPEGATIPNFIGTGRDAKISYVGGDGNDVVLTAQAAPGTLQFASATYSGVENGGSIALSVTRSGGTEGAVSADYTLAGGSATGGAVCGGAVDYINTGGTVSFTAGSSTPQTINVQICPDATLEPDELFTVTLSNGNIGTPAAANVTILNDDCTPMPANMLSWYSGDGNANDIVGTNTGTWTGTAKYATGKVAQAFDFDGTNRVSASGSGSLNITGAQMTMDGWVYPRSGANAYYFGRTAPSDHPYVLMTISGNLVVIISTATDNQQFDTGFTMPVNAWTHIAMTYDAGGVGDKLRVYANGTQVFSAPTTGGNLRSSTLPLTIGGRTAGDNPFNGLIDEVEVFDRALDATAIAALASASGGGKCHTSTIQFSTNAYSVTEGNVNAPITVTRVGAHDTAATFNFATSGGTATAGAAADYDDVNLTGVTFAVGEVSKVVNIPIHDDNIYEVAETVNIAVSNIATAPATTPGTPLSAVLTINPDGDTPPVLNVADATFAGDSLVAGTCSNAFEISLVGATQVFPVTVHYQTSNDTATAGQDYTATSGTLTFNNSIPQCIPVTILEDPVNEPTEQFFIDLDTPTNATIGDGHGIGTIPSGDPLSFTIGDVTQVETNSGTTNFVFNVAKVGTTSQPSQVTISTVNGSAVGGASCGAGVDFVSQSGSVLNFLATDASLPFTVTVCGDTDFEGDEAFTLSATATVGASATTVAGTKTGTILNDDCTPPPAGMVAWYPGQTNATDIVGTNNGTETAVTHVTGRVGQAFSFNGSSKVEAPPTSAADITASGFTVDFWMKAGTQTGGDATLIEKSQNANSGWAFQADSSSDGKMRFAIGNGSSYPEISSDASVLDNQFHHITGTWNSTDNTMRLYVDGVLQTQTAINASPANNTDTLNFGYLKFGNTRYYSGLLDEVEIFNRALTAGEVANLAAASSAGKCLAPIVQFARSAEMEDESQTANVIVRRSVSAAGTTDVTATTVAGGTATGGAACTAGVDYKTTSQLLSFDIGDVEQSMSIEICPDLEYETPQTIKLQLSGPSGAAVLGGNSEIFLTINDTATQFTNNHDPINIPAFGATASPYPSTINVTGAPTVNGGMRVTLYDVELANPDNLDILLVGPLGQKMVIMGDAGGSTAMSGPVTLTFDDAAGQVLPNGGPLTTGKFEPTTWEPVIAAFPAPAPVFPYVIPGSALGGPPSLGLGFGAGNPNGQWRLFVRDDAGAAFTEAGQPGAIAGGWGLQFVVPTAAGVSVSGRVTTAEGRGIRGAVVTITGNSLATPINVTTGVNGRYMVEGLTAGETYIVTIRSRRFVFTNSSRIVKLNDNVGDADFIADPGTTRGDQ